MTPLLLLLACREPEPSENYNRDPLWPFPNAWLVEDGRLALPQELLPMAEDGTPLDVSRLSARTGFSPVQTAVIDLGVALDPSSLPTSAEALAGQGAVQLWDLDAGSAVRAFAEVDAWPEPSDEAPVLLVRPLEPMTPGHEIAVVVTTAARTEDGEALEPVGWFEAAAAGEGGPDLEAEASTTPALVNKLANLGVKDLALAFSFPVDDGGVATLGAMLDEVSIPTSWTWSSIADTDAGDPLPEGAWRQLQGTYTADSWMTDAGVFEVVDGAPAYQGSAEAELFVHVPESARDAEPGTVPVWIFGHGIFGNPAAYLEDLGDDSAVVALADRTGAILVATPWTGLTASDLGTVLSVAMDFGTLPRVTDPLAQALANQQALVRLLLEGGLLDDPELGGLPDKSRLFYYGISLGGIEGAVLLAHEDRLEHAVLHAAGSAWSTMLERSYAWQNMENLVANTVSSPRDRQLLYAVSQLYWDPVDPANVARSLADRSILWQECLGDDMVPNLSTELMARGVGATLLDPYVSAIAGLQSAEGPLSGPALSQLDPELGRPEDSNRPSERTQAHNVPRSWEGTIAQTARFLDKDDPGVVEATCGEEACSASNPD